MILLLKQNPGRQPMELFAKLFDSLLVFVYHCFDRIVIHGYLSGLSRPEQVVHFVRHVLGIRRSARKFSASAPRITATGWRLTPAISTSPSNGRRRDCAKRTTSYRHYTAWRGGMPLASTSSSGAWNRAAPSASPCPSFPPKTPTTVFWQSSAAASPTTTSTFA